MIKQQTLFRSYQFSHWYPFSVPESKLWFHLALSCHVYIVSSDLWWFLVFVFLALTLLKTTDHVFCRMLLIWVFLMVRLGLWKFRKTAQEVACPSYHTWYQLITGDANFGHLVKVESARFLHCNILIFFSLPFFFNCFAFSVFPSHFGFMFCWY